MAESSRLRFIQGDSVFRLNQALWSDAEVEQLLVDYIEHCRLRSPWILDSRRDGNTIVVEHLFPIDEVVDEAAQRMDIDERFVESIPLTYPIVFEVRSGYLRIYKPLAEKYGALVSDFIRGLWEVLTRGAGGALWDHGFAQCGGTGTIPLQTFALLEPDEPLVGFYRVDVDMQHEAWLFITPQGVIVEFDDGDILAFDKADMRNPSVPSAFFTYSMLKVEVAQPDGEGFIKTAFSPKDLGELEEARADVHTMLASPHYGRPRRMIDPSPLPWIEVDGDELDYMAQTNLERYRGRQVRAGRNPFGGSDAGLPSSLDNPFDAPQRSMETPDDNPFR